MQVRRNGLIAAVAVALLTTLGLATSATATSSAPAKPTVPAVTLTPEQRLELQARVDGYLKDDAGARQISLNQVSYDNGSSIVTVVLPSETKARAINEPITPQGVADCPRPQACVWIGTNFNGDRHNSGNRCGPINLPERFLNNVGSMQNNLNPGTQARIFNGSGEILTASLAPSRINDLGVLNRSRVRSYRTC
jgi:hypothetical protein